MTPAAANLIDTVLDVIEGVVVWVIDLIPSFTTPAWMDPSIVVDGFNTLAELAAPLGAWIPVTLLAATVGTLLSLWAGMTVFRLAMKLYAMVRGGAS